MMAPVPITVAIPTYGRDQILVDTIRRVLALVPPAAEVIVLDQTKGAHTRGRSYSRGMASLVGDPLATLVGATDSPRFEPRPN